MEIAIAGVSTSVDTSEGCGGNGNPYLLMVGLEMGTVTLQIIVVNSQEAKLDVGCDADIPLLGI